MPQNEHVRNAASIERLESKFDGLNSKFDGLNSKFEGLNSKFERLDSDVKSSFASIAEYLRNFEAHSEERFKTVIDRFDTMASQLEKVEQNTGRLSEDLTQLRSLTSERFDITAGQQRISDQGQYRIERNLTDLQRRVEILENERRS